MSRSFQLAITRGMARELGELLGMVKGLTPKQERFAQAYAETGNASEAYRRAGYSFERFSVDSLKSNAFKIRHHPGVAARIEELQAKAKEDHEVTMAELVTNLREACSLARDQGKASEMVQATMGLAKLTGHIVDKREVDWRDKSKPSDHAPQIVTEKLIELWRKSGGEQGDDTADDADESPQAVH